MHARSWARSFLAGRHIVTVRHSRAPFLFSSRVRIVFHRDSVTFGFVLVSSVTAIVSCELKEPSAGRCSRPGCRRQGLLPVAVRGGLAVAARRGKRDPQKCVVTRFEARGSKDLLEPWRCVEAGAFETWRCVLRPWGSQVFEATPGRPGERAWW